MSNHYTKLPQKWHTFLWCFLSFFLFLETHARVISDNNLLYQSDNSTSTVTLSGFSVPESDNSLLVVYAIVTSNSPSISITFGGTPLTQLGVFNNTYTLSISYLAQGDLAAPISGDIIANFAGSTTPFEAAIYAVSYKNVNQVNPMDNFAQNFIGTATNSSISIPTANANDLVVDFITARHNSSSPTLTEGGGQIKSGEMPNQITTNPNASTHALSEKCLSVGSGAVNMDWIISTHNSAFSYHIAAKINGATQEISRVISDGNLLYQSDNGTSTVTLPAFSVPEGDNSLLVVYAIVTSNSPSSSITFGGTPLIQLGVFANTYTLSISYLAQGDLAAPISGDIIANFAGSTAPFEAAIYAVSYKNVNQVNPMDNFAQNFIGTATNSSISVTVDDPNDLVVDFITARHNSSSPTLTEGGGQSKSGEMPNQIIGGSNASTHALSEKCLSVGNGVVNMDWIISTHNSAFSYHIGAKISAAPAVVAPPPNAPDVPTLSDWGLIILALMLLNLGTLYLIQKEDSLGKMME